MNPIESLPEAPLWSIQVGELGRWLVFAGLFFYFTAAICSLLSKKIPSLDKLSRTSFLLGSLSLFGTFICLATLFINDRFEYKYVYGHSDLRNAFQYKLAAVWAGQQGSFLLWAVTSAIFGLFTLRGTGEYRRWYLFSYSLFLAALTAILAYESAFNLQDLVHGKVLVPPDGVGLSPALHNYWMVIHPPTIFLGFGSLTVMFCYAFAAMMTRSPMNYVVKVRPWAITSLTLVGVGLAMGGFWAYETLGWGGFWAWDPVENTSFVPWLFLAVAVHGYLVQQSRKKWILMNLVLSGLPFLSFLYGTFLTRSGFLGDTSVHSFAKMERAALWLLIGLLVVFFVGFFTVFFTQRKAIKLTLPPSKEIIPDGYHREGLYRFGSLLLTFFALSAAVGMSVPLIQSLMQKTPKVVEESGYHFVLAWPFIPLMLVMAIAPYVSWKGSDRKELLNRLYICFCISFFMMGMTVIALQLTSRGYNVKLDHQITIFGDRGLPAIFLIMGFVLLCYLVMVSHTWRAIELKRKSKTSVASYMSHVGLAMALAGLLLSRGLEQKEDMVTQEGNPMPALGMMVEYKEQTKTDVFDRDNKVVFDLKAPEKPAITVKPGLYMRRGESEMQTMVWPAIHHTLFYDIYFVAHSREIDATEVTPLNVGESKTLEPFKVTYVESTREGEAGMSGTKFGAKLKFESEEYGTFEAEPKIMLNQGQMDFLPAGVGKDFWVTLQGIDAGTKSARIQLHYMNAIYPVSIFFKPFVGFVWLGTGIMALAGLLAAWNRRALSNPKTETTS